MARPFILGLTGSIGMGKSTVAQFFREAGVPVWDADGAVHMLYGENGLGVPAIARIRPEAVVDGKVDREALKAWIAEDSAAITLIEAQIHPLVAKSRLDFLQGAEQRGEKLVVLDVPLLYETKGDRMVDEVLVVSAPADVQRARVLARPGMTEEMFETILAKQLPDAEKRARADHVIESVDLEATRWAVNGLIEILKTKVPNA